MFHNCRQCVIGNFRLSHSMSMGFLALSKRGKMIAKAKKEKSQMVVRQETHLTSSEHEKLKKIGCNFEF